MFNRTLTLNEVNVPSRHAPHFTEGNYGLRQGCHWGGQELTPDRTVLITDEFAICYRI